MADSYNELFGLGSHSEDANLEGWWKCGDDAASTVVTDSSSNGNNGTAARNTSIYAAAAPAAWLPGSFQFDGTQDYFTMPLSALGGDNATLLLKIKIDTDPPLTGAKTGFGKLGEHYATADDSHFPFTDGNIYCSVWRGQSSSATDRLTVGNPSLSLTSWRNVAVKTEPGASGWRFRIDGSTQHSATGITGLYTSDSTWQIGKSHSGFYIDGNVSHVSVWSRTLSDAEEAQAFAGPEPLNTVAPVVSGTETVGSTLSCTTGTWNSQSNGTLSYSYQWTRSDDGAGTNEADISGATSSTYTLVSGDSGKYIRCRVRASNDGGFDAAEDTNSNFTGAISGGGSTYTLTASAATVAWAGQSATLAKSSTITASASTVAWEGQSAGLSKASTLTASAATVAWEGQSGTLTKGSTLTASAATVAWEGQAASLAKSSTITASAATVAWAGQSADLTYSGGGGPTYTLTASAATVAWAGQAGTLSKASTLTGTAATVAWEGQAATLTYGYTLTASAATLAWEGQSGTLAKSSTITSSAATLAWAGQAASLTYSGATSTPGSLQWSSPNVRLQWSSPDTRLQWS